MRPPGPSSPSRWASAPARRSERAALLAPPSAPEEARLPQRQAGQHRHQRHHAQHLGSEMADGRARGLGCLAGPGRLRLDILELGLERRGVLGRALAARQGPGRIDRGILEIVAAGPPADQDPRSGSGRRRQHQPRPGPSIRCLPSNAKLPLELWLTWPASVRQTALALRPCYQGPCAPQRFASSASTPACAAPAGASSSPTACGSPTWPAASSPRTARASWPIACASSTRACAASSPATSRRRPRSRRPSSTRMRARR